MAASPVSKLAEIGQDRRAEDLKSSMAAHQKFVVDSMTKMEEASKAMMDMVARNNSQVQAKGIKAVKILSTFIY